MILFILHVRNGLKIVCDFMYFQFYFNIILQFHDLVVYKSEYDVRRQEADTLT